MQPVLLLVTLALSIGVALAISRIFLGCVFHLMAHRTLPFVFYWRRVAFVTALFWLWYPHARHRAEPRGHRGHPAAAHESLTPSPNR
jgi:hypothetical protein